MDELGDDEDDVRVDERGDDEDDVDEDNLGEFAPPLLEDEPTSAPRDGVAIEDVDIEDDDVEDLDIEDLALAGDDPTGGYGDGSVTSGQDVPDSSSD